MIAKLNNISVKLLILFVCLLGLNACFKEPKYSNIPKIGFDRIDINTNIYKYNDSTSTGSLYINFSDGDGDLGVVIRDTLIIVGTDTIKKFPISGKVFYTIPKYDSIRNYVIDEFTFPEISNIYDGAKNGFFQLKFKYIFDDVFYSKITSSFPSIQKDTINFKIWIKDRAGNQSNVITTPDFMIKYN